MATLSSPAIYSALFLAPNVATEKALSLLDLADPAALPSSTSPSTSPIPLFVSSPRVCPSRLHFSKAMRPALCRARFSTSVQGGGPQPVTSPPSFHSSTPPIQSSASSLSSSTPNPFCRLRLTLAAAHNLRPRPPAVYPCRRRPQ